MSLGLGECVIGKEAKEPTKKKISEPDALSVAFHVALEASVKTATLTERTVRFIIFTNSRLSLNAF